MTSMNKTESMRRAIPNYWLSISKSQSEFSMQNSRYNKNIYCTINVFTSWLQ